MKTSSVKKSAKKISEKSAALKTAAKKTAKKSATKDEGVTQFDLAKFFERIFSKKCQNEIMKQYLKAQLQKKGLDDKAVEKLMKAIKISVDKFDMTIDVKVDETD